MVRRKFYIFCWYVIVIVKVLRLVVGVCVIVGCLRRGLLRFFRFYIFLGEGNGVLLLSGIVVFDLEWFEDFFDEEFFLLLEESEG